MIKKEMFHYYNNMFVFFSDFITVSSPGQPSAMQSMFSSTQSSSSHGATDILLASASTQRNTLMDNVSTLSNVQGISSNGQPAENVADAMATQTVNMMENNARNACSQATNQNNQMNSQQIVMDNSGGNPNLKNMMSAESMSMQQNVNSQTAARNHGDLSSPNVAAAVGSSNVEDVSKGILNAQNLLSGSVISIPLQSNSGANQISINPCSENQGIGMMNHAQLKAPMFVNIQNMNAAQTVPGHGHVDSVNGCQGINPSVSVGSHDSSAGNISMAVDRSLPNVYLIQGTSDSPKMLIVNTGKDNLSQIPCSFASPAQLNIKDVLTLDSARQVNIGEPSISLNNEQNLFLHKLLMEARGSLNIVCSKDNGQPVHSPQEDVSTPSQGLDIGSRENVNLINMLSNNLGILNTASVPLNSQHKHTPSSEGVGMQTQHMDLGSQDNLNLTRLLSNNPRNVNPESSSMNAPKNPGQGESGSTHLHHMDLGSHDNINLSTLLANDNRNMNSAAVQERMQAENSSGGSVAQNSGALQQRMDLGSQDNINLSSLLSDNKGNMSSESIRVMTQPARPEQIMSATKEEVKSPVMMANNPDMTHQGTSQMGGGHPQVGENKMESRSPPATHMMINEQGHLVSENMEVCQQGNLSVQHVMNQTGQNVNSPNVGGQNMAGQNINGQAMTGQNMPGQNVNGQSMAGQNRNGQNIVGQNMDEQNIGGQNMSGQNIGGQNMSGQNIGGQNMSGQNIGGQNMSGQNIGGQNMSRQNIAGQNVSGQSTDGQQLESRMEISIQDNYGGNQPNGKNVSQASTSKCNDNYYFD